MAASFKVAFDFSQKWNGKTYHWCHGGSAMAAPAHSQTAHVHECRGRAPVAEWLAISILDSIYERARRSRSSTRWGELTTAARATCAHLSPLPHHQEPDGTPKQNGQQRTCRECSRHCTGPLHILTRDGGSSDDDQPSVCLLATPDSRAENLAPGRQHNDLLRGIWWFNCYSDFFS